MSLVKKDCCVDDVLGVGSS